MACNFPDWASFTPEFAAAELPRLLEESEKSVAAIETSAPATYEGLVWTLDDATRELWRCWGMVAHMTSVMNSDAWRKVEEDFQPRIVAFAQRVGQSRPIYESSKAALASLPDGPDRATRARILEKMVLGAELSGVALEGAAKERFNAIEVELAKLGMDFQNAVLDATKAFSYEKDGTTYTIDDANYPQTMKECADREVRETLYRARATRAPENTPRAVEILRLRAEMASLLGFANFAELSVARKCAPSVDAVFAMFDELDAATAAPAAREEEELGAGLEPWDIAYAAERLRERKYAYSEEELKRHFDFPDVLAGLFKMAKFLFDVDVEEIADDRKPTVWHPDVRFFAVKEKGEEIAYFYMDPYVRNGLKRGGAWMNEFTNRSDRRGEKPLSLIVLNQKDPDAEGHVYMPFREVETLFHEFGHALQCMLTRVGEEDAAGINLVEWDAVEVASQFMENWCLDDRTGIYVPEDLKKKVLAAKNFRAATACRRQLALGKTDMMIHVDPACAADPDATKRETFRHFGMPMIEGDLFLNSFTHIFCGGYSAGYYGYKWAEVMSADCYGAFEEAGLENDAEMRRLGSEYRETILGLGGSMSAYDVFVKFRGRRPTSAALLRQQGLAS